MAVIKSDLDIILDTINKVHDLATYKKMFLKELKVEDIDEEPLNCKYDKWLMKKFTEGLE